MLAGLWSSIARLLRLLRTPYTRSLEDEVARLRAENRPLMNSILGIAVMPPLPLETKIVREHRRAASTNPHGVTGAVVGGAVSAGASAPRQKETRRHPDRGRLGVYTEPRIADKGFAAGHAAKEGSAVRREFAAPPAQGGQGIALPANATRRRSWQQINRILEIEESRRIVNRDNSEAMTHANRTASADGDAGDRLL